jgi:hypothetical protein
VQPCARKIPHACQKTTRRLNQADQRIGFRRKARRKPAALDPTCAMRHRAWETASRSRQSQVTSARAALSPRVDELNRATRASVLRAHAFRIPQPVCYIACSEWASSPNSAQPDSHRATRVRGARIPHPASRTRGSRIPHPDPADRASRIPHPPTSRIPDPASLIPTRAHP